MSASRNGRSHRIVVHLPTHTELWYSTQIPFVGWRFPHRGRAYEVVTCRVAGSSYILEARAIETAGHEKPAQGIGVPRGIAEERR